MEEFEVFRQRALEPAASFHRASSDGDSREFSGLSSLAFGRRA